MNQANYLQHHNMGCPINGKGTDANCTCPHLHPPAGILTASTPPTPKAIDPSFGALVDAFESAMLRYGFSQFTTGVNQENLNATHAEKEAAKAALLAEYTRLTEEITRLKGDPSSQPTDQEGKPQARPLTPREEILAGDEAYVDGFGPWEAVNEARIGELYTPWNGETGIHVAMRRPAPNPGERPIKPTHETCPRCFGPMTPILGGIECANLNCSFGAIPFNQPEGK